MDELETVASRKWTPMQGFIFSRAVSQDDVLEKLESGDLRLRTRGPGQASRRSAARCSAVSA